MNEKKGDIKLQVGVKIFLKNPEGKYLLLHRNAEKYPDIKALWDIVGGRIHPGTPLLENLKREVKEETGIVFQEPKLISVQDILRGSGLHVVRLTYVGYCQEEPILDDEHDEYRWLTIEQMKDLPEGDLDGYVSEIITGGLLV